jgi:hypothetical protein
MAPAEKITKADIEAKLTDIKTELETTGDAAKPYALAAAVVGVVALAGIAYLLGKRKGRKKTTIVEVRRV